MANNTVLQWQSHVTDSTDREVILGNIDLLEKFAKSINGGDKYTISDGQSQVTGTLSAQFNLLRTGIKNGTLNPASWKDSEPFGKITTALEVSSGKLLKRVGTAEGNITSHGKALSNYGKRIKDAEGNITSHTETLSGYGERLDTAEGTLTSHTTALGNKLDSSIFEKFKTGDFKTITDWKSDLDKKLPSFASASELDDLDKQINNVRTLLSNEISHWTRAKAPQPLDSYKALADLKKFEQPWEVGVNADENYIPERHIGDLCTVTGATQPDKGVSYRFIKHDSNNTYTWTKVIDNDGAKALSQHSQFVTTYNERQKELDKNSSAQQKALKDLLEKYKNVSGNLETQGENIEGQRQEIEELKKIYKVSVTTKGYIKDGAIKDGTTYNSKPAIAHTAHVYTLTGKPVVKGLDTTLTWTINKGRTSKPVARTVTGVTCYVTADDFVKDGTNPHYYDIELNSTF